jgi:peptidoglycan/xylan/chitin deacetylase (PgdA/CDA1 family)
MQTGYGPGWDGHKHGGRRRRRRLLLVAALAACAVAGTLVAVLEPWSSGPRSGTSAAPTAPAHPPAKRPAHRRAHAARPPRPQGPHDRPVPILMYHVVAVAPAGVPYPELFVPPPAFEAQMAWLAAHRYQPVTLARVYRYWRGLEVLPPHPVVLSFDDGYRADIVHVLPVLRRRHWPGVLNLVVKNLGINGGLYPRQVRRLIANGWELDAHSLTHPDLTQVGATQLKREVAGSRSLLERTFGVPVQFFCYPSGRFDAAVVAAVRKAGYLGATTTEPGLGEPSQLFTLHRIRVNGTESLAEFAASLASAGGG